MSVMLDLSVTIVSWNTRELLRACLRSLARGAARVTVEVHVVDNASSDGSADIVRQEFPQVRLTVNAENVGFARANNQSWHEARGRYWMLLNSDTEVRPGCFDELVAFMDARPRAGLATARLVDARGTPQHCAQAVPGIGRVLLEASRLHKLVGAAVRGRVLLGPYWTYDKAMRLGWTWGTALVARREAVEQMGPLAHDFFMYGEDLEWCLRMRRAGWEVWFCPAAEVVHHGGQSSARRWDDQERFFTVMDGIYTALERHYGRWYVRALQAAALAALGVEWLAARFRRRTERNLGLSLLYYLRALRGIRQVGNVPHKTGGVHPERVWM